MRFYFHLREGPEHLADEDGCDAPDLPAAIAHLLRETRRMVGQEVADTGEVRLNRFFEIVDENGSVLHQLKLSEAITIYK